VFLVGDVWPQFWRDIVVMLAMGAVLFLLAAKSTQKRLG
jgi:ABC-2 type transport system permease protein